MCPEKEEEMATELVYPLAGKRVWVAGHRGMVGAALVRRLAKEGCEVITADRSGIDLRRQESVEAFVADARPQALFMAAARVGGILANDSRPAEFIYDNMMIEANITEAAYRIGVEKMLFLGSSCIYPKMSPQPIREDALLTGPLEATNQWYAVAKIAGIKLCQAYRRQYGCDFIAAMPTNLYGPEDNFDLLSSHVLPALIRKAHEAKVGEAPGMVVLGSGKPLREFLHVDDCADALVFLMQHYSAEEHVNVGYGRDVTIAELARLVADAVGFRGRLIFDPSGPDGAPRKLMDSTRLQAMGWAPSIPLQAGVAGVYSWYLENLDQFTRASRV